MKAFLLTEDTDTSGKSIAKKNAKVIHSSKFVSELEKQTASNETIWVTDHSEIIECALSEKHIFEMQGSLRKKASVLIFGVENFTLESTLTSLFKKAFVLPEERGLSIQEVLEVLSAQDPSIFVIGGIVNSELGTLALTRGDLSTLVVPLSTFRKSGDGISPEFSDFSVTDGGQTLSFGEYEASVDSVLYEYDADYRKKLKAERAKTEKSLGACLKRLRLQKGLLQSDFPGVDEKVIGRIERGEVAKPQASTLKKIASTLGVKQEDILSY